MSQLSTNVFVYPLDNYRFGRHKARKEDKDRRLEDKLLRLKQVYEIKGMRRSVSAIMIVFQHNFPHILLFKGPQESRYWLPGGRLRVGEGESEGLKRKLDKLMKPEDEELKFEWEIVDLAMTLWRPTHSKVMFPYLPPHVTRPKEMRRVFMVQLPEKGFFKIPENLSIIAVPAFDLFDNPTTYGIEMSSIPLLISRYNLVFNAVEKDHMGFAAQPQPPAPEQQQQHGQGQGYEAQQPHGGSGPMNGSHMGSPGVANAQGMVKGDEDDDLEFY